MTVTLIPDPGRQPDYYFHCANYLQIIDMKIIVHLDERVIYSQGTFSCPHGCRLLMAVWKKVTRE